MGEAAVKIRLSIAEYLDMERLAEERHEYLHGERFTMAPGTLNLSRLGVNLATGLNLITRKNQCIPFNGHLRIRIEEEDCFLYPEASVVCGPEQGSPLDPDCLTNPVLIAEILSKSTEAFDRGEKFRLYRTLPSLREYVLISQHRPMVEVFFHDEAGWHFEAWEGMEATLPLRSLDGEITMSDLYRNVVWEE